MQPLTNYDLAALAASEGLGGASLVLRSLRGAPRRLELEVRPAARYAAASMIKVPIAAALAAALRGGRLRADETLVIAQADMTANDAASPLVPGYRARFEELGELMIARSDNVATNALIGALGRREITAYARELGLRRTVVRRKLSGSLPLIDDPRAEGRNAHPPRDAAALFAAIAEDRLTGAAWLRELLAATEFNTKLSAGLEPTDRFLHKTGDTDEVSHDGGILELSDGARYVVVVYSALASSADTDARFARLMRALRPYLQA